MNSTGITNGSKTTLLPRVAYTGIIYKEEIVQNESDPYPILQN